MNNIDILEEMFFDDETFEPIGYIETNFTKEQQQAIKNLIVENKKKNEEIENQDKTIDRLVKEQEEREKYTHQLEAENKELKEKI